MEKQITKISITMDGEEVTGKISDGYHTFDELYDHRITLWIALCKIAQTRDTCVWQTHTWRSQAHHPDDQEMYDGWFVLGMGSEGFQMSYHLPLSRWEECDFAETLATAPKWDGHTPLDVINRLKAL